MSEFVVIPGLSGAGRSQAADILEDLGWFVIDNLPPALIPKVVELAQAPELEPSTRVALVVGTGPLPRRGAARPARPCGRRAPGCGMLFLEGGTDVLVRRYESTRRRHPLRRGRDGLAEAIEAERALLEPVKAEADVVVDTTDLNVHELRHRILDLFGADGPAAGMQTTVVVVRLQARAAARRRPGARLPVPAQPALGRGAAAADRPRRRRCELRARPATAPASSSSSSTACSTLLLPAYVAEGKSYLTIAFGCTGGRHRSVAIAEEVAALLREHGFDPP